MQKDILKTVRDNMPEALKDILSGYIRNRLIKNRNFIDTYARLIERETLFPEVIKQNQFIKLKNILIYAYNNVPYYHELFQNSGFNPDEFAQFEEIKQIPFLTRDILRNNSERLISAKRVPKGSYYATTGGTTGDPLQFPLDYNSIFAENAFIYYYRRRLGYNFKDRLITFRGVEFGHLLNRKNPMYNEIIVSPFRLNATSLSSYLKIINAYKPAYLNGYLSALYFFAQLMKKSNTRLAVQLKGIFLISENIDPVKRSFIEDFFQVKSLTFYGHSERVVIAQEVGSNEFVFDPYYGYTETIDLGNDTYEIVGTGFNNLTMPFIRYKTGDICRKVGSGYEIAGHYNSEDLLIGRSGERFSMAAFNFHSDIFGNVIQYQLVQEEPGKVDLLLNVNENFQDCEIANIIQEIDKKTDGVIKFSVKIVDQMILSARGKFKPVISKIAENTGK
jgi:phenylacetate-CoA ligase